MDNSFLNMLNTIAGVKGMDYRSLQDQPRWISGMDTSSGEGGGGSMSTVVDPEYAKSIEGWTATPGEYNFDAARRTYGVNDATGASRGTLSVDEYESGVDRYGEKLTQGFMLAAGSAAAAQAMGAGAAAGAGGSTAAGGGTAAAGGSLEGLASTAGWSSAADSAAASAGGGASAGGAIAGGSGLTGSLGSAGAASGVVGAGGGAGGGSGIASGALGTLGRSLVTSAAMRSLSPDAPSTAGLENLSNTQASIATRQQALAEQQYADQKAILEKYSPMIQQMLQGQIDAQSLSSSQSQSAWNDYLQTWKPVEQKMAQTAMDWNTSGRADQEGARSGAAAAQQVDQSLSENERALSMAGASPQRIAALQAAGRLSGAKNIAGATSNGRAQAEQTGLALLDNAARFGRNMPSSSLAASQLGTQQAGAVQNGVNGLSSLTSAPATTTSAILGQAMGGMNSAANTQMGLINAQNQATNQRLGFYGDIISAGLGSIGGAGGWGKLFGKG